MYVCIYILYIHFFLNVGPIISGKSADSMLVIAVWVLFFLILILFFLIYYILFVRVNVFV